jgi:hypothetical protein
MRVDLVNIALGAEYQVTYGTGEQGKLFIRLSLPTQLNVLTEPGPVHTFKVRFVRFVYYFIPLFFISHWLMQKTYENKLSQVFTVTDFPQELAEKKTGH